MADSLHNGESSQSTMQLNIKTLESQMHSFHVDKKISVSSLKEKIEQELRIPVSQQRLIFRGRVLKDDHYLSDYQVDNGHTLHLVTRQSSQSQSPSDGISEDTPGNNRSSEANGMPSSNRVGQIAHSVLLGTINVGDVGLGDGIASDATRVIGAVLNSFGLGGLTSGGFGAAQPSNMTPQGNEMEGSNIAGGGQGQEVNQSQPASVTSSRPFQSQPQVLQIPLNAPISDSLTTQLEFMTQMEQAIAQNGYQQDNSAINHNRDTPRVESSSDIRGVPNTEALAIVLNHADRLLRGPVATTLSHIAGRLENEGSSSDPHVRSQIQRESIHLGLVMQHLGALCLELGRTVLMLRMGQQPAQSSVNAGPAVYISPTGPNPIMVQPFPWQTSPLFGGIVSTSNSGTSTPVVVGTVPRHLNIHIHAGTAVEPAVSSLGTRASNGETLATDRRNGIDSSGGPVTVLPVRSFMATPAPFHVSSDGSQSVSSASVQLNPSDGSLPLISDMNLIARAVAGSRQGNQTSVGSISLSTSGSDSAPALSAELNSYLRNLIGARVGNQSIVDGRGSQPEIPASVPQVSSAVGSTTLLPNINSYLRNLIGDRQAGNTPALNEVTARSEPGASVPQSSSESVSQNPLAADSSSTRDVGCNVSADKTIGNELEPQSGSSVSISQTPSSSTPLSPNVDRNVVANLEKEQTLESVASSCQEPRTLEVGGIQESANHKHTHNKTVQADNIVAREDSYRVKDQLTKEVSVPSQEGTKAAPLGLGFGNLERKKKPKAPRSAGASSGSGNQPMLTSQSAGSSGRIDTEDNPSGTNPSYSERANSVMEPNMHNAIGAPNPMSEVLQSPAFDGLLTGISEQVGVGSPNMLRSMLMQLSQNPQIMNTVGRIAQQVDTNNIEAMLSTTNSDGQPGGIDFSRMMQQMMPVVSRVLSATPVSQQPLSSSTSGNQNPSGDTSWNLTKDEIEVQQVIQRIELSNSPAAIFEAVAGAAAATNDLQDFTPLLTDDQDLITAYMEKLRQDIQDSNSK